MGSNWLLAEQVDPLKLSYHVKAGQGKSKTFPSILSAEVKNNHQRNTQTYLKFYNYVV